MYHGFVHGELGSEGSSITGGIGQGRLTANVEGTGRFRTGRRRPGVRLSPVLAGAFVWLFAVGAAQGQGFQRLAAVGDPAPGGGDFTELEPPSFDGNYASFRALRDVSPKRGIFRLDLQGGGVVIADTDTLQPGASGEFSGFGLQFDYPSLDDGEVVFNGAGSGGRVGVYRASPGSVSRLVDDTTMFPDAPVALGSFGAPSSDGRFVTSASNSPSVPFFAGIYSEVAGMLFSVVDTSTPFFNVDQGVVGGGLYAFQENDAPLGPHALYVAEQTPQGAGPPELVVHSSDPIPDRDRSFDTLLFPQLDRGLGDLCFWADDGSLGYEGFFRWSRLGGTVELVADTDTPIPGGSGNFSGFSLYCSINSGEVVFAGRGTGFQEGIYRKLPGAALEKVIDTSDLLEGAPVFAFDVSREAVVGGRIAFQALGDFGDAIFVTPAPEPGSTASLVAALGTLAALARRRRSR
jgi:hypothetical protein